MPSGIKVFLLLTRLAVELLVLASPAALAALILTGLSGLVLPEALFKKYWLVLFVVLWILGFLLTLKTIDLKRVIRSRLERR